ALAPSSYDVAVAEAQLALVRAHDDAAWVERALTALAAAGDLDGCGNRVELLTARAYLQRARHARARGDDPRADLALVLEYRGAPQATTHDNGPWVEVLEAAAAELAALEGALEGEDGRAAWNPG